MPDIEAARKRSEEARKAAEQARAREGGLTSEVERLEAIAHKAEEEAAAKTEELRSIESEVEAARRAQSEHWEKAKQHGDAAKGVSSQEAAQRLEIAEGKTTTTGSTTTTTSGQRQGQGQAQGQVGGEGPSSFPVPEVIQDFVPSPDIEKIEGPDTIVATDLHKTVPSLPHETHAGHVTLPVETNEEEYKRQEEAKQRSSVEEGKHFEKK
ncbi:hypothetical protein Ndes2526B_g00315 [Nannochloris sp. 'desiccata']